MTRYLLLLALAAAVIPHPVAGNNPALLSEVQQFYNRVVRVWNTGDYKAVASGFVDDAALLLQGTPAVQGIENITRFFQQTINYSTLVSLTAIDADYLHSDGQGNGHVFVRANVTTINPGSSTPYSSGVVHILTVFDGDIFVELEGVNGYPKPQGSVAQTPAASLLNTGAAAEPMPGPLPVRTRSLQPVTAGAAPLATQDPYPVRDRIAAANKAWMAAYASGNATAVAQLYSPDATVLTENALPAQGRDAIAAVFRAGMAAGVASTTLSSVEVGIATADVFYFERGVYVAHDKSGSVLDTGKYLVVWRAQPTLLVYIDVVNSDGH